MTRDETQPTAPSAATPDTAETGRESEGTRSREAADQSVVLNQGRRSTIPSGAWIIIVGALMTVGLWGLSRFSAILAPAFLALTLVLTIRPIHRFMVRRGVPKWVSAIASILVLVLTLSLVIGVTVLAFLPLPDVIASYQRDFTRMVNDISDFLENNQFLQEQGYDVSGIDTLLGQLDLNTIMSTVGTLINQISGFGGLLAVIALSIFFIVIDTMTMDARSSIVEKAEPELHEALSGFEGRVRQYWLVSTIFGAIVAVFDWIALEALGIPLSLAWAVIAFVTNYIPNIGFILGVVPPALIGLLEGGWQLMLWVIVAYSLINFVIQSLIQPKFTADAVGLSVTVTFLSLMVWGVVIGPLGALLAVPLTLFFKAILVDSSTSTRWLDAFLISESEAERKLSSGRYEVTYSSPHMWGGLPTVVARAARGIKRPAGGSEKVKQRRIMRRRSARRE
ncbi:AI-2E family transporter [Flaviflexus salsibiostraticola]|uniref:AI-2E family transporter n=1 Tax=Flaviflexus salsibiostraticola TaxID=1282737 RepID=A0A3Q8WU09_9ACTO|nr:AI-2E family transporter [Flaviflexus salsibiostraticola]AZN30288.1 AI-2E family transporter [Flaviflexus salsibiostraticola]